MKKALILIICVLFIGLFVIQPYYVNAETDLIIYVDGINGNDESGTGLNPSLAVKTLKKAYELLQTGGSIYIVNTISINEEMTITDTQYKDENKTINLQDNAKIKEINAKIKKLSDKFKGNIIIRIPVVTGFNDDIEEIIKTTWNIEN